MAGFFSCIDTMAPGNDLSETWDEDYSTTSVNQTKSNSKRKCDIQKKTKITQGLTIPEIHYMS